MQASNKFFLHHSLRRPKASRDDMLRKEIFHETQNSWKKVFGSLTNIMLQVVD